MISPCSLAECYFITIGRLESPIDLVRKMASAVALTFSKVVDPKNPLYLDDDCCENVDWEFGVLSPKEIKAPLHVVESKNKPRSCDNNSNAGEKKAKAVKQDVPDIKPKIVEINSIDHDQISDTVTNGQFEEEECDEKSMSIDACSDSSLEPYDLSDDDTDLQKKFSHLSDIAAALRKPDDPDGVSCRLIISILFKENIAKS
jgi:telomere length regulation protein